MTIRLTTPDSLDRLIEALKKGPFYDEETVAMFLKYCIAAIKEAMAAGEEVYLTADIRFVHSTGKIAEIWRYYKRSDITTDEEWLASGQNNDR